MGARVVIVGESNPFGGDPRFALYHLPRGASGDRLREIVGLRDATYEAIPKVNLCAREWKTKEAVIAATRLRLDYEVVVACGRKVAVAFGCARDYPMFFPCYLAVGGGKKCNVLLLPHPSGLNRMWNEDGARARARRLLAAYAPSIPWGESDE